VSLRLSRHADVELGYLNRHIHRLSGDVSNDVVPVVFRVLDEEKPLRLQSDTGFSQGLGG